MVLLLAPAADAIHCGQVREIKTAHISGVNKACLEAERTVIRDTVKLIHRYSELCFVFLWEGGRVLLVAHNEQGQPPSFLAVLRWPMGVGLGPRHPDLCNSSWIQKSDLAEAHHVIQSVTRKPGEIQAWKVLHPGEFKTLRHKRSWVPLTLWVLWFPQPARDDQELDQGWDGGEWMCALELNTGGQDTGAMGGGGGWRIDSSNVQEKPRGDSSNTDTQHGMEASRLWRCGDLTASPSIIPQSTGGPARHKSHF